MIAKTYTFLMKYLDQRDCPFHKVPLDVGGPNEIKRAGMYRAAALLRRS